MIKHLRILVVDDDPEIPELLGGYLETCGYAVRTCSNGAEALAALRAAEYDLLVSDINMSGMNGFELLRETRKTYPRIGIILMTAYDDAHPIQEALQAGADGYIPKPFSLRKFSRIFEQAYWQALSREDWWEDVNTRGSKKA
ncbi:MAG: response regulator [Candidatus Hydrogenedentes bacterium]|nr:response regulator [Candidatus Hydrogenedentota bacterium]